MGEPAPVAAIQISNPEYSGFIIFLSAAEVLIVLASAGQPEVIDIAAEPVATNMIDIHTIRNRTVHGLPNKAMHT
ncbi:hypothetical protein LTSEUGA_1396 [Salmonella enterica subsp. enterica serovar Uganda str. R8-3404]|uniref:Uncharacterized protein n=1 Tax=Salmonella enterica subsp. enterica serovar Uganda str. R8-3404 TaxID=913083 RepID=A0A6C8H6F9_SALET|nr:hypothetical protein LTSEUGA_1396 [Salmonella enterica subsp. enterica serovar Uganda str. R8-3404]